MCLLVHKWLYLKYAHAYIINIALVLLNGILCIQLELAHNVTIYKEQKVSGIIINIHSLFINH